MVCLEYWVIGIFFVLALLIAYNTTFDELRMYYLGETQSGWKQRVFNVAKMHFFIDRFYSDFFHRFVANKPFTETKNIMPHPTGDFTERQTGLAYWLQKIETNVVDLSIIKITRVFLSLSAFISKTDDKIIDGLVLKTSGGLKTLGDKIRKVQSGQLQFYLLGMLLLFLTIILIKIIIY
jgi:hypothetical protein